MGKSTSSADFGSAKKGNALRTFNGTQPYMTPEMFTDRPYTAAIAIWALGMVVAHYLSRGRPGGYSGEEGLRWCAAVGLRANLTPAQVLNRDGNDVSLTGVGVIPRPNVRCW